MLCIWKGSKNLYEECKKQWKAKTCCRNLSLPAEKATRCQHSLFFHAAQSVSQEIHMLHAYLWIGLACKVCTRFLVMKAESFLAENISFYIKIKKQLIELVWVLKFLLLDSIICRVSSSVSKSLHAVRRHLQNINLKNCLEKISVNLLRFCKVDFKCAYLFIYFLTQGKRPRTDTWKAEQSIFSNTA